MVLNLAEVAQVVERGPEKPGVASASLALGTISYFLPKVLKLMDGARLYC